MQAELLRDSKSHNGNKTEIPLPQGVIQGCGPGMPSFICHLHMMVGSEPAALFVAGVESLLAGWTHGTV